MSVRAARSASVPALTCTSVHTYDICPPRIRGTGYCTIRKSPHRMGILSGFQSLFPTDAGHPGGCRDLLSKGARMATRAVARRSATASGSGGTKAASSVRAVGGEIADRDLVGMYLDEIARTPLLDAAKEVELSQTIEAGVYARKILDG